MFVYICSEFHENSSQNKNFRHQKKFVEQVPHLPHLPRHIRKLIQTNKYIYTKQTRDNNSGIIYLWWNLPVTPEKPQSLSINSSQICTALPQHEHNITSWEGAQSIFTLKLNNDHNIGTSNQSISLLSPTLSKH